VLLFFSDRLALIPELSEKIKLVFLYELACHVLYQLD
jgi:hypothetical protein